MNWRYYPDTATSPAFYMAGHYRATVTTGHGGTRRFTASFDRENREPWRSGPFKFVSEAFAACEAHQKQHRDP